jgi:hypothetical protein
VEVDQSGSARGPRRIMGHLGVVVEPGNQPIWGESPVRRMRSRVSEEQV